MPDFPDRRVHHPAARECLHQTQKPRQKPSSIGFYEPALVRPALSVGEVAAILAFHWRTFEGDDPRARIQIPPPVRVLGYLVVNRAAVSCLARLLLQVLEFVLALLQNTLQLIELLLFPLLNFVVLRGIGVDVAIVLDVVDCAL